jgi:catechol O-methyltransferase
MHINWTFRKAPRIAVFLARQKLQRLIDKKIHGQKREAALLDYVQEHAPASDAVAVLSAMDSFARNHRWLMNIGPKKGRILIEALQDAGARNVLEIGAYCGYSATLMGECVSKQGGNVTSIEISPRIAAIARQVVEHAGLSECVEIRIGVLSNEMASLPASFDAVLLDHWKDEYLPDLQRLEQAGLIHAGTVVVADNVGLFAVPDYLDYVRNSGRYDSRYVASSVEYNEHIEDGVEVSVLKG